MDRYGYDVHWRFFLRRDLDCFIVGLGQRQGNQQQTGRNCYG